jgi:hypothetical protein
MYDKQRVYSDNTEYSPEELRAKEWVARSQSGLLGQSMTYDRSHEGGSC